MISWKSASDQQEAAKLVGICLNGSVQSMMSTQSDYVKHNVVKNVVNLQ